MAQEGRVRERRLASPGELELAAAHLAEALHQLAGVLLGDVSVWLVPVSLGCYGWFMPEGDIYVPAVNGAQLSDFFLGHHTRLTDVLRHEWAHALADRRPRLVETKRFRSVFGAAYDSPGPAGEYHPDHHLTPYAATNPSEDFAETFHFYLRHKGRLPLRLREKPVIARKWSFVDSMARH